MENGKWNEEMIDRYELIGYYDKKDFFSKIKLLTDIERFKAVKSFLKEGSILEMGCGDGILFRFVNSPRMVGLDLSKRLIKIAKEKYPNVEFMVGDARNTKLTENFDNIVCSEVLEHIKNCDLVIKESYRMLKNDGFLIITVPNDYVREFIKKWFKRLGLLKKLNVNEDIKQDWHINKFNKSSIVELVESNGFSVIGIKTIPVPFVPMNYIIKCCKAEK